MTAYPWCKLWNEAPDDAKWLTVAEMAGSSRPVVWYAFSKALTHANQNEKRGSITGLHSQVIASWCQVSVDEVNRIFQAFRELGILIGDRIAKWAKRQTEKMQRGRSATAERQARFRERKGAAVAQGTLDLGVTTVPPRPVTPVTSVDLALHPSVTFAVEEERDLEKEEGVLRTPSTQPIRNDCKNGASSSGRRRGARIPEDWQPDASDREFARTHGVDPEDAAIEFRNYWLAEPGQRACKLNWSLVWQNRCRELAKRLGANRGRGFAMHRDDGSSLLRAARRALGEEARYG